MRPELAAIAATQSGLVLRRQAVALGYTERELRTHTGVRGPWVVVRRGVYAERALWESVDRYDGQLRLRDVAAHLAMTAPHVLSHDSAARALRLPFLRSELPLTHVTRPGVWGSRTEHGVKHHLSRLTPPVVVSPDGLPVTGLARTALDLGREHGFRAGLAACDAAMRRGVTRVDFDTELGTMSCWPGITASRAAVEHADPGAETVGESLARELVMELGNGRPRTQFPVRLSGSVAWCDLLLGCHVFEFDGQVKYLRADRGGVADRPVEDVLWDEKGRQTEVCAEGLGMSRIVWADFWGAARGRALRRLRTEFDLSSARFGVRLPEHLERAARELADERHRRIFGRRDRAA